MKVDRYSTKTIALLLYDTGVKRPSIVPRKVHIFCSKYEPKGLICSIIEFS